MDIRLTEEETAAVADKWELGGVIASTNYFLWRNFKRETVSMSTYGLRGHAVPLLMWQYRLAGPQASPADRVREPVEFAGHGAM